MIMKTSWTAVAFFIAFPSVAFGQDKVTLDESVCTALRQNRQVRAASEKAAGQEYNVKGAFADFLPKGKVQGQYFRTGPIATLEFDIASSFTPDPNKFPDRFKSDPNFAKWLDYFGGFASALPPPTAMEVSEPDQVSLQFRVEQPLFSLYPIYQGYEMQKDGLEMARLAQKVTEQEVRAQVVTTYLGALKAKKMLSIAMEAVELIGAHLDQAKKFVAAGVAHISDQLMAEVKLADAKNNVVRAENGIRLGTAGLAMMMGGRPSGDFDLVDIVAGESTAIPRVAMGLRELEDAARTKRSELRIIDRQVDLAERNVKLQWSNYIPQSALVGSYGYQHGNTFMPDWSWAVGGVASLTFWDWLKTHDQIQAAKHSLSEAKENREYAREGIVFSVKQAFFDLRSTEQVITTGEAAIKEAKENHRVARMKYDAQMATSVDVLDAAMMLAKAKADYYAAVYDFWAALARLARAVESDEETFTGAKPLVGKCQ
ncbi:MAG: TolC family protein [Deltaproteobacteria bacterium]|nr:TolC family protein [Deltaproteobacteria bacterium]